MTSIQEVFDKAAIGLLGQMEKSQVMVDSGPRNLYHGPNGLKCAIGHCIDDAYYSPKIEGKSAATPKIASLVLDDVSLHERGFLKDLQQVHDSCPVENWRPALISLAEKYGLKDDAVRQEGPGQ